MTDPINSADNNTPVNKTQMIITLLIYCVSGTLLTLINKLIVVSFPYTSMLLVVQNGMAVCLLLLASRFCQHTIGSLPLVSLTVLRLWVPLVFLFVIMLMSSLLALVYVSVPTLVVIRNLTTLLVAILEYIVLRNKISGFSVVTLVFMLLGAILYAKHDLTFSVPGYIWLCINILGTSTYQIYIKKIIHLPLFENVGSIGMSYYNNLISLPILLISACFMGELTALLSKANLNSLLEIKSMSLVLFSGVLGFSLSISAFALNKQISATSMMVANNVNKFSIIVLSEVFVQSTLDMMASIGAVLVLFLGWLYSHTIKSPPKNVLIIAIFIFTAVSGVLGYKHLMNDMSNANYQFQPNSFDNNTSLLNKLWSVGNQLITILDQPKADDTYLSYLPASKSSAILPRKSAGITVKNTTKFQLPETCVLRNSSIWKVCKATRCVLSTKEPNWHYPRTTNFGEKTGEFVNRVLEIAWGTNPPSVDLYFRSGCNGIMEMKYLFESIEVFWPRFLGSIIIVLDDGDEEILKNLLPVKPTHHYVISFEDTPCMPGRVFNQYSYLNLDRHSSADFVVTIDSDCIFHTPVTPDIIFRQGKVILASSRTFQGNLWVQSLDAMLGAGLYNGHYMVTQPVTFALSTFSAFRRWFYNSKKKCYEDQLSQLSPNNYQLFCWMCQLGTYLERGNPEQTEYEKYWFLHLDNSTLEPMLRYSIHVTYEPSDSSQCEEPICYEKSANEVIRQGLCRAFGSSIFSVCTNSSNLDYVNKVTFFYAHTNIQAANETVRMNAVKSYLDRLHHITKIALSRSKKAQ